MIGAIEVQVGSGPSKKLSPSQVVNRVFRFSGYSGFAKHYSFRFQSICFRQKKIEVLFVCVMQVCTVVLDG